MTKKTRKQVRKAPNPTGKGGFKERPQDRASGRWKKEDSISYQYNMLLRLSKSAFKKWLEDHPEDQRTMAQEIAFNAVSEAMSDFKYLTEVTDRTEGKSINRTELSGSEEKPIVVDASKILDKIYGSVGDMRQDSEE